MNNKALDIIKWAEAQLELSDIPSARKDAEALFMESFDMRREDIYLLRDIRLPAPRLDRFRDHIKLRASRYPLQYILNGAEFMGLPFTLEEGVFIPRPETELLVEKTLEHISSRAGKSTDVLDIGTGCGNIAISLTKNATGCRIIASDISEEALKAAAENARLRGAEKHIEFIQSDLFGNIADIYYNYFDIIISNPPYVRRREVAFLQPEISYEDAAAFDGGDDGLYFYRRILSEGIRYLKKDGVFAFEIGYDQAGDIARLFEAMDRFSEINFFKDYSGHDRAVIAGHRREKDKIG